MGRFGPMAEIALKCWAYPYWFIIRAGIDSATLTNNSFKANAVRGIESDYANARSQWGSGSGSTHRKEGERARHVAHKYLRMLLIIAQWRTVHGNGNRDLGRGTWNWELATENWQLRSRQVAFLFNFKSGKIYITLVACTSTPAPCHTRPASGRMYELWRGTFEPCWMQPCCLCCARQIETRF